MWKFCGKAQFRANRPKLCANCAFPQNFNTGKLGEITAFFAVKLIKKMCCITESILRKAHIIHAIHLNTATSCRLENLYLEFCSLSTKIGEANTIKKLLQKNFFWKILWDWSIIGTITYYDSNVNQNTYLMAFK